MTEEVDQRDATLSVLKMEEDKRQEMWADFIFY